METILLEMSDPSDILKSASASSWSWEILNSRHFWSQKYRKDGLDFATRILDKRPRIFHDYGDYLSLYSCELKYFKGEPDYFQPEVDFHAIVDIGHWSEFREIYFHYASTIKENVVKLRRQRGIEFLWAKVADIPYLSSNGLKEIPEGNYMLMHVDDNFTSVSLFQYDSWIGGVRSNRPVTIDNIVNRYHYNGLSRKRVTCMIAALISNPNITPTHVNQTTDANMPFKRDSYFSEIANSLRQCSDIFAK